MIFDTIEALERLIEEVPQGNFHRIHVEASETHYTFALSNFWEGEIYTSQFMVSKVQIASDDHINIVNFQFRLAITRLKREMEYVQS